MMASSESQERELKRHCGIDNDRLSNLPDPILCKILSLLPTKNAIATSILSTKWKSVSPFSYPPITLDLDDSLFLYPPLKKSKKQSRSFTVFVDKLLNKTEFSSGVQAIMLKCHKHCDEYYIMKWIWAVFNRFKVRELVLRVRLPEFTLDVGVFEGCTTLTRLELGKDFKLWVPEDFELPNVKFLVLFKLNFCKVNGNYMLCKLIDGCSALEDLFLNNCDFRELELIEIESCFLKKLTIKDSLIDSPILRLDLPNLEVLEYDDCIAGGYELSTFESLHFAHIDVGWHEPLEEDIDAYENYFRCDRADDVLLVVQACSRTTRLSLATQTISVLQRTYRDIATFEKLTSLALGCVYNAKGWELLAGLLTNAPNLVKLTFEGGFWKHEGGYSSFMSALPKPPFCLEVHVMEIEFKVFGEEEDEIKLVEYFLNNGKALQKLQLCCLPWKKMSNLSRLHLLPGHSKIDFQPR